MTAAFLGLILCFDLCLVTGLSGQRLLFGRDPQFLACLVAQTIFLSLLVSRAIPSPAIAIMAWVANFLLVNAAIAIYAAQHPSHYGYASAFLAGQLAFLAVWLVLGEQSLGWKVLGTCASSGILIVGWYGYAARRSTADWNLIWMSETLGVMAAAVLLRFAGFQIRCVSLTKQNLARPPEESRAEGEGQYKLWHLMAGLFVASCLLGLARLLGVIKPTYFADLAASEIDAADVQRGLGVGLAAALAVAFAAHSILLRANFAARYLPPLIYTIAMGYGIHAWGPPYVDASVVASAWSVNLPDWTPTTSQWSIWMLFNAGMATGGTMFLHALGYRLTRGQRAARVATNAR
ncbi:MAG: hypothetical protein ACR2FY_25045 [Pirellulaceae bacterium]